jgi:hypothetical protein
MKSGTGKSFHIIKDHTKGDIQMEGFKKEAFSTHKPPGKAHRLGFCLSLATHFPCVLLDSLILRGGF